MGMHMVMCVDLYMRMGISMIWGIFLSVSVCVCVCEGVQVNIYIPGMPAHRSYFPQQQRRVTNTDKQNVDK